MDFHPADVIISLINIAVLFILLRLILWKHVIRFMSERSKRVQNEMDEAEKSRHEADELRGEYTARLGSIEQQQQELLRETTLKATEESDKIIKDANNKANNLIREAEDSIEAKKTQALEEAQAEIASLATDMAARILQREVSADDSINAVDEFFKN